MISPHLRPGTLRTIEGHDPSVAERARELDEELLRQAQTHVELATPSFARVVTESQLSDARAYLNPVALRGEPAEPIEVFSQARIGSDVYQ